MLQDSGARVLFVSPDHQQSGADFGDVHLVTLSPEALGALSEQGEVTSPQDHEALAVLLYTAGTSGRPKAAMLTHRALLSHLEQIAPFGIVEPETTILAVLPLFHVYGLNAVLGSWLRGGVPTGGCRWVRRRLLRPRAGEWRCDCQFRRLCWPECWLPTARPMGSAPWRTVVSGAAPLRDDLRLAFTERTGLRVEQGYGLTEAGPGIWATFGRPLLGHGRHRPCVARRRYPDR